MAATDELSVQQLIDSQFSIATCNSFLESVLHGVITISPGNGTKFIETLVAHLRPGEVCIANNVLIDMFQQVLAISPGVVTALNEKSPQFVRDNFPLSLYLVDKHFEFSSLALKVLWNIVELCPKLTNWKELVDANNPAVVEVLQGEMQGVNLAKELRDYDQLADRLQDHVRPMQRRLKRKESMNTNQEASNEMPNMAKYIRDQQEEQLNGPESEIQSKIAVSAAQLNKATKNAGNSKQSVKEEEKHRKALQKAQDQLIELHLERRKTRATHLELRDNYIRAHQQEFDANYLAGVESQAVAMRKVEEVYEVVKRLVHLLDVSDALSFLDAQLNRLCYLSFTMMVAGTISVGKSTAVNAFTGENLCPNRVETMTSIPTRYVHDPSLDAPVMVVPFANRLNIIVAELKKSIVDFGMANLMVMVSSAVRHVVEDISKGWEFKPRYEGAKSILEASTNIHDIFRLAVEPAFADSLGPQLPLDWSGGLNSFLTVYVKFPDAGITNGLITFSLIDTPGINEYGVQRLRLQDTIHASLELSQIAALVTTQSDAYATDLRELRRMFDLIKEQRNTRLMCLLTHQENVPKDERGSRQENIAMAVSQRNKKTFSSEDVYLISGKAKVLGMRLNKFIATKGRIPLAENDPDPEGKALMVEFLPFAMGSGGEDVKLYNSLWTQELRRKVKANAKPGESWAEELEKQEEQIEGDEARKAELQLAAVKTKAENMEKVSGMDLVIADAMKLISTRGTQVIVEDCYRQIQAKLAPLFNRYSDLPLPARVRQVQTQTVEDMERLKTKQIELKKELDEQKRAFASKVAEKAEKLITDYRTYLLYPSSAPNLRSFYVDKLVDKISRIMDPKTKNLLTESGPQEFPDQESAERAVIDLVNRMRQAITEGFLEANQVVPAEAQKWSQRKKEEIEAILRNLNYIYKSDFSLTLPELTKVLSLTDNNDNNADPKNGDEDPEAEQQAQQKMPFRIDAAMVKKTGLLATLKGFFFTDETVTLDPAAIRNSLVNYSILMVTEQKEYLQRSVKALVGEIMEKFFTLVNNEMQKAQNLVNEALNILSDRTKEERKPFFDLIARGKILVQDLQK